MAQTFHVQLSVTDRVINIGTCSISQLQVAANMWQLTLGVNIHVGYTSILPRSVPRNYSGHAI
jgi:hypothetical protein